MNDSFITNLFENSPRIICTMSKISGVIGIVSIPIALFIAFINLLDSNEDAAIIALYVALGGLSVFLSSLFTYAFGMLVRNSEKRDEPVKSTVLHDDDRLPEM